MSTLFWSYIERYHDMGWSVVPVNASTKQPDLVAWKRYQSKRATLDQLADWSRRWTNMSIACVTGKLSGVFVIDDDGTEDLSDKDRALHDTFLALLPETATVITSKGRHYYYRYPSTDALAAIGHRDGPGVKTRFIPNFDLRGEGGCAILPPSVHPSGTWYAWDIPPSEGIAECPPGVLKILLRATGEVENSPAGAWHIALAGGSEGSRNQNAASVIGKILEGKPADLHPMLWEAVKYWNDTKNKPPLPETELKATFKSIAGKEGAKQQRSEPTWFTARDLQKLELEPLGWAVEGFIPDGLNMLAAKPKVGKSVFSLDLACCVARDPVTTTGGPLERSLEASSMGQVKHGDVLYLALEDNERRLQDRASKMMREGTWPERLRFTINFPPMFDGGISALSRAIESCSDCRLVVIDTLAAFLGAGESKSSDAYRAQYNSLVPLAQIAKRLKVPILIVHHLRKGKVLDFKDAVSGTLGLSAALDNYIGIDRPEGKTIGRIYVEGRDVDTGMFKAELVPHEGWRVICRDTP